MLKKTKIGALLICKDELLILERNPKQSYTGWGLITGKIDQNESTDQALVREIQEETGIQVAKNQAAHHFFTSTYWSDRYGASYTIYWFYLILEEKPPLHLQDEEWLSARWISVQEAAQYLHWPSEHVTVAELLKVLNF